MPMAFMMLLILFNYTVVRSLKDALVVETPGSGAEVISFIKSWVVLTYSIVFVIIFHFIEQCPFPYGSLLRLFNAFYCLLWPVCLCYLPGA